MQGFPQKDMAECTKGPWLCWFTGLAAVYFGCLNNDCGFAIKLIDLQPPDQYDMDKMNTMGMLSCCWLTPSHKCKESRWQLGKVFARLGDYNETLPHPKIERCLIILPREGSEYQRDTMQLQMLALETFIGRAIAYLALNKVGYPEK